jgi:hypothetical protein
MLVKLGDPVNITRAHRGIVWIAGVPSPPLAAARRPATVADARAMLGATG